MSRKMKDSGVEWIGDIPETWEIIKCKYISQFFNGFAFDSNELSKDYKYPVIRIGDIKNSGIDFAECQGINRNDELEKYKVYQNDILLAMSGATVGKVGIVNQTRDAYINQRVGIIRSEAYRYLFYNLSTTKFIEYILLKASGSAQPNMSEGVYENFIIPFPSAIEQERIADFLDRQCSELDAVITKTRDSIAEYKKLKQAVITQAVTKGVRGERLMKDSGIKWIGEIPEDWELIKAKYCAIINHGTDPQLEGEIPVYGSGASSFKTCGEYKEGPAVLVGRKGATLHIPHYIEGRYWNVDTAFDVTTNDKMNLMYYYYLAICFDYKYYMSQTTLPGMTQLNYKNMYLPYTSLEEQQEIVTYLDEKCAAIDAMIAQKEQYVAELENYKKSLIYEYVTGKKEVSNV